MAARAVVAVTRREPGAQAPFAPSLREVLRRSWWRRLKGGNFAKLVEIAISRTLPDPRKRPERGRLGATPVSVLNPWVILS